MPPGPQSVPLGVIEIGVGTLIVIGDEVLLPEQLVTVIVGGVIDPPCH
jgi:hypothetical protein